MRGLSFLAHLDLQKRLAELLVAHVELLEMENESFQSEVKRGGMRCVLWMFINLGDRVQSFLQGGYLNFVLKNLLVQIFHFG